MEKTSDERDRTEILAITRALAAGQVYKALGTCRKLVRRDAEVEA
jgi:flagellar biosynthesis regulator FlbT